MTRAMAFCPICGEVVAPRESNKAFPFCNARCKSIDLGKWLSEQYTVPTVPDEAGETDGDAASEYDKVEEHGQPTPREPLH